MGKITQKYNKIKENSARFCQKAIVFVEKKSAFLPEIDKISTKNVLLFILAFFLLFFSYFMTESVNDIKSAKVYENNFPVIERNIELENKIRKQTQGYPIESMTRIIAKQDEQVAAFLVAIAKKESNWGKRTPKLNGEECNNLWGFRQKRERMGSGGHTCFDNQREAVESVATRIEELIKSGVDTPEEMVVWKCGYSCDAHSNESVAKWIADVNYYYSKF
ncbi:MAG: hypothetical protein V3574_03575 [Candidatus Moraniibacteriota bacterium]